LRGIRHAGEDFAVRIDEIAALATERLPGPVAEFFNQGAGPGVSASEAVSAWDRIRFLPRMLRDVAEVSTAVTVLGQELATPILVAPTAMQRAAHPDGEVATARATAACGSLMEVSTNSGSKFADIGATGSPWWLQLYVMRDRGLAAVLLQAAQEAGASAIVLTVDTPEPGRKYSAGQTIYEVTPDDYFLANLDWSGLPEGATEQSVDLTPDDIGWLRDATGLPVVVKGVLRADDARDFVSAGAAAVQVSNHGGRQLDQAVATADALPEIVAAVEGTAAEVYVDGGIRRAEHVLAALALGARAVFLGRPVLWALAAGGPAGQGGSDGVTSLLAGLTDDLVHAMMLAGARSIAEIDADLVHRPAD
jgi:4-hydroxymandelate oxidase